jgi:hypothetical protein
MARPERPKRPTTDPRHQMPGRATVRRLAGKILIFCEQSHDPGGQKTAGRRDFGTQWQQNAMIL